VTLSLPRRLAVVTATLALVGCGTGGTSGSVNPSATSSQSSSATSSCTVASCTVVAVYVPKSGPTQPTLIASDKSLEAMIPAKVKWTPIDNAPATFAAMLGGSVDVADSTGNPPTVAALVAGTPLKIVFHELLDSYGKLIVKAQIKTPQDLVGKTIGDKTGSSWDYGLQGWIGYLGLTGKVKVVGFPSNQAIVSAYTAGQIDGAYIEPPFTDQLIKNPGGTVLTTAEDIGKQAGFYGINITPVRADFIKEHPDVVQGYVCAEVKATELFAGSDKEKYFAQTGNQTGQLPADAVSAGNQTIYTTPENALSYLVGPSGTTSDGIVAQTLRKTAKWMAASGRISRELTAQEAASAVDPSFLKNALAGKCG
jgi:taurine transport system substrate-binding protein